MNLPIVKVIWVDSTSIGHWHTHEVGKPRECHEIISIGFLLAEFETHVEIVQSIDYGIDSLDEVQVDSVLSIPVGCIISQQLVKEKK